MRAPCRRLDGGIHAEDDFFDSDVAGVLVGSSIRARRSFVEVLGSDAVEWRDASEEDVVEPRYMAVCSMAIWSRGCSTTRTVERSRFAGTDGAGRGLGEV